MGKLTSKSKHTVKVGNHQKINMISKKVIMSGREYKRSILKVHIKLRYQQFFTNHVYIYRLINKNLLVTANQKSITDICT